MNVPNTITLYSAINGFLVLFFLMRGQIKAGLMFYGISFICDRLDGVFARKLNQETPVGSQLDSLADFLCFGVIPLAFSLYLTGMDPWMLLGGIIYIAAAALRLACFNIGEMGGEADGTRYFIGLPTTFCATYFYLLIVLLWRFPTPYAVVFFNAFASIAGIGMVSSLRMKKFGFVGRTIFAVLPATMLLVFLFRIL